MFLNQSLAVEHLGAATKSSVINSLFHTVFFMEAGKSENRSQKGDC